MTCLENVHENELIRTFVRLAIDALDVFVFIV